MSYGGTTCDRSCLDKQQSLGRGAKGITKKGEGREGNHKGTTGQEW